MSILSRFIARRAPQDKAGSAPPAGSSGAGTSVSPAQSSVQNSAQRPTTSPAMTPDASTRQPHTVSSFDADLKVLAGLVAEMGIRAGRALAEATRALTERNIPLAQQVIASDRGLDLMQHEIEEK